MMDSDLPCFTYAQFDGCLNVDEVPATTWLGTCYSGKGVFRNKPLGSSKQGYGPLPKGWYTLVGPFDNYTSQPAGHHLGNCVFRLVPDADNQMFGRSGFLIHGDNLNHDASDGCIVAGPSIRQHIAQLFHQGINRLKVT